MQHPQPLYRVQFLTVGGQLAETSGHISRHSVEEAAGLLYVLPVDGEGDVPLLYHTVGGVRHLVHQHGVVLRPVAVQIVVPAGDEDLLLKILPVEPLVVNGDLGGRTGVQGVEQLGVSQEYGCLVLFGSNRIVDIREADSLF